ncbi:MAG: HAMP domain-containing sensor histidine kinase [Bermanella sp.]
MNTDTSITINGVEYEWQPEKGTFDILGTPSALFWLDPSLLTMLQPLAEEVGYNLFRLQVAASSSDGTDQEYDTIVTVLGDTFEEGFAQWGKAAGSAGWGTFEILYFQPEQGTARVRVRNTWELIMQRNLPKRWGCPFIQGKVIGLFSRALKTNCWADEVNICYDEQNPYVEFDIYPSSKTISTELAKERRLAMQEKEHALAIEIEKKTQQLNAEKIKAEAASHAKTKFLSAMGHELRTPLNGVLGFAQLLASATKSPLNESQQQNMQQILDSGNTMLSLVNNILLFSEAGVDASEMVLVSLQPKATITQLIKSVLPMANTRDIGVTDHTPDKLLNIRANEHYFREILSSFLINAINYIPVRGEISILAERGTAGYQRFIVRDNGPGIASHHQANLFEAFERLEHSRGPISGAGVGLCTAKMLAQHMGGNVGFYNNPQAGASFWVELPLATQD